MGKYDPDIKNSLACVIGILLFFRKRKVEKINHKSFLVYWNVLFEVYGWNQLFLLKDKNT